AYLDNLKGLTFKLFNGYSPFSFISMLMCPSLPLKLSSVSKKYLQNVTQPCDQQNVNAILYSKKKEVNL
uniref:Uncharacterized protein n=1 Tax=Oryza brachyantha TaxID=4533 RepID=J3LTN4_ORYBR